MTKHTHLIGVKRRWRIAWQSFSTFYNRLHSTAFSEHKRESEDGTMNTKIDFWRNLRIQTLYMNQRYLRKRYCNYNSLGKKKSSNRIVCISVMLGMWIQTWSADLSDWLYTIIIIICSYRDYHVYRFSTSVSFPSSKTGITKTNYAKRERDKQRSKDGVCHRHVQDAVHIKKLYIALGNLYVRPFIQCTTVRYIFGHMPHPFLVRLCTSLPDSIICVFCTG